MLVTNRTYNDLGSTTRRFEHYETGHQHLLKINQYPGNNLIDVVDENGISGSVISDYYGRYGRAFVTELDTFAQCVRGDSALRYELPSAVEGMKLHSLYRRVSLQQ